MTVDEILATGQYTDRRGRVWEVVGQDSDLGPAWAYWEEPFGVQAVIATRHLRAIIERDQHRDECAGLGFCLAHPVPHVISLGPHRFEVFGPRSNSTMRADRLASTLSEAMDAARALAVGE